MSKIIFKLHPNILTTAISLATLALSCLKETSTTFKTTLLAHSALNPPYSQYSLLEISP